MPAHLPPNSGDLPESSDVPASRRPDFYEIARALRTYYRMGFVIGFLALVFVFSSIIGLPCMALRELNNGPDYLFYLPVGLCVLSFWLMIFCAIRHCLAIRKMTRLTGFRREFDSGKPPIPEQVAEFLRQSGYPIRGLTFSRLTAFRETPCVKLSDALLSESTADSPCESPEKPTAEPSVELLEPTPDRSFAIFPPRNWSARSCCFALIVWLVIGVVGLLLFAGIIGKLYSFPGSHLTRRQTMTINTLCYSAESLDEYHAHHGEYPASLAELQNEDQEKSGDSAKLSEEKLSEEERRAFYANDTFQPQGDTHDGWNKPLYYKSNGKSWTLASYGADDKPGGIGIDADILLTNALTDTDRSAFHNRFLQENRPTFSQIAKSPDYQSAFIFIPMFLVGLFIGGMINAVSKRKSIRLGEAIALLVVSFVCAAIFAGLTAIPSGH